MNRKSFVLFVMALSLVITSCETEKEEDTNIPHVTTLSAKPGDYNIVNASGKLSNFDDIAPDFEYGIEYSTKKSFDKDSTWQVKTKDYYSEDPYTVKLCPIESERIYYYRAYCINQTLYYYGETKHFSFYWESRDDLLIGTWDASDGYSYMFYENHTGKIRYNGLSQQMDIEWDLVMDKLKLRLYSSGPTGASAYTTFVIKSLTDTMMEAYEENDPNKEIITFRKL